MMFLLGAVPQWFGLDQGEAIGFVQVSVFSIGLFLICLGGTTSLNSLWPPHWKSIVADIGTRLAWTGFVIALAAGMADVFGLGTSPITQSSTYFGYWQARGVLVGEIVMVISFLMMIPYKTPNPPLEEEEELIKISLG
jgi:hypothetical protein